MTHFQVNGCGVNRLQSATRVKNELFPWKVTEPHYGSSKEIATLF